MAIVGQGMADDAASFAPWWNGLKKTYNIRANIGINGDNYTKYGTSFGVQLVVIDKTGPTKATTLTGQFDSLDGIPIILGGIRNERTANNEPGGIQDSKRPPQQTGVQNPSEIQQGGQGGIQQPGLHADIGTGMEPGTGGLLYFVK